MIKHTLIFLQILLSLAGCNFQPKGSSAKALSLEADSLEQAMILEAREDSLEMATALSLQSVFSNKILADVETEPVKSAVGEDSADDPAIWYNSADPSSSLILGTDKNAGIYVYNLEGKLIQAREIGRINNIDLREGFLYNGKEQVLVAGSNRSNNCITLFTIDTKTGLLSDSLINIPSGVDEVYGICLYKRIPDNEFHVFVNGKGGGLEQWLISTEGRLHAYLLRRIQLSSQPEGMVSNDQSGMLYVGLEGEGIFCLNADPNGDTSQVFLPGSSAENQNIAYDVEGLALFSYQNTNYLIASIQGNFSYAIFNLDNGNYLTSFIISDGFIDGVEETDGLEIVTRPLNKQFPDGILVVQDGFNTQDFTTLSQNFKYVSTEKILELLESQ
jgi:3-phytase